MLNNGTYSYLILNKVNRLLKASFIFQLFFIKKNSNIKASTKITNLPMLNINAFFPVFFIRFYYGLICL